MTKNVTLIKRERNNNKQVTSPLPGAIDVLVERETGAGVDGDCGDGLVTLAAGAADPQPPVCTLPRTFASYSRMPLLGCEKLAESIDGNGNARSNS